MVIEYEEDGSADDEMGGAESIQPSAAAMMQAVKGQKYSSAVTRRLPYHPLSGRAELHVLVWLLSDPQMFTRKKVQNKLTGNFEPSSAAIALAWNNHLFDLCTDCVSVE